MDVPATTPTDHLFLDLRIMPLNDRFDFRGLTTFIKALNKCAPPYISDMFSTMSAGNRMSTRSCARKDMHIPTARLNLTRQGLRYQGSLIYNEV